MSSVNGPATCVGLPFTTRSGPSASDAPCGCPPSDGFECRVKGCADLTSNAECALHSECTTNPGPQPLFDGVPPTPNGNPPVGAADDPFFGCFEA